MESKREPFLTWCFALVICKNKYDKFLVVKETRNRGWWIPGGLVDPGEDFMTAAIRETKEEAGINIELKGVLRVEHSLESTQSARMRVIFYAEPVNHDKKPKSSPDKHSELAAFLSVKEIQALESEKPGHRGEEIIVWPLYVMKGGLIMPMNFFCPESKSVTMVREPYSANLIGEEADEIANFKKKMEEKNFTEISKSEIKKFKNISVNAKNWRPFHYAIRYSNLNLLEALIVANASFNAVTHKNRNCLHFAVNANLPTFSLLVNHLKTLDKETISTLLNQEDFNQMTPVDLLRENNDETSKQKLKQIKTLLVMIE